jgi:hypothetical protein
MAKYAEFTFQRLFGNSEEAPFRGPTSLWNGAKRRPFVAWRYQKRAIWPVRLLSRQSLYAVVCIEHRNFSELVLRTSASGLLVPVLATMPDRLRSRDQGADPCLSSEKFSGSWCVASRHCS